MNPDLKVYRTQIDLESKSGLLRTGMSCEAEVIVEHHEDTLYVPVQAVVRIGRETVVYVPEGEDSRSQQVEIGLDNNRMVRIVSGVEENDLVLLNPPLGSEGTVVDEARSKEVMEMSKSVPTGDGAGRVNPSGQSVPAAARGEGVEHGDRSSGRERRGPGRDRGEAGERRRGRGRDMSPEDRAKMRERFQNMTPEEREEMKKRFRSGGGRPDKAGRERDQ